MHVVVRDATADDSGGIAAIGRASYPETYRDICAPAVIESIVAQSYADDAVRDSIRSCAAADAHFLVAERDGRVAGFLQYDGLGAQPELHRIYVEPALKRRGIGSALIVELHQRLRPDSSYVLMVVAANEPAVAFYRRHGLAEDARIDGVAHMREHMGVEFPPGTPGVPALLLRFTKPGPEGR